MTEPLTDYFGQTTQALADAIRAAGIRAYTDPAATVDPSAVVIGPPQLVWESLCNDPTHARYLVYACVAANDRAITALATFVPQVVEAIHALRDATVTTATPNVWSAAGQDYPCYEITVEVSL